MIILSEDDITSLLQSLISSQCHAILDVLTRTLIQFSAERRSTGDKLLHQPHRTRILTRDQHRSLFMPCSDTVSTNSVKVITRPGYGGPLSGIVYVFTPEGKPIGLLGAREFTGFRTALASMAVLRHVTVSKRHVVVFGAGKVAEWHVRLILLLWGAEVESLTVVGSRKANLAAMVDILFHDLGRKHQNVLLRSFCKEENTDYDTKLQESLAKSDILLCCTAATQPLFPQSYLLSEEGSLRKQRFISLVGSCKPHMQEVDKQTLLSGEKVYVDSIEDCLLEAGELIMGGVGEDQLTEIGEALSRGNAFKVAGETPIIFKSVGMGCMDLAVGRAILDIAIEEKRGTVVDGF